MRQSLKNLIKMKQNEMDELMGLQIVYPDLDVEYTDIGMIYTSTKLNATVDCLDEIVTGKMYGFYQQVGKIRIYSSPAFISVREPYSECELDWLSAALSVNPKLLIELMKKINSVYLQIPGHYSWRFPSLLSWIEKYK